MFLNAALPGNELHTAPGEPRGNAVGDQHTVTAQMRFRGGFSNERLLDKDIQLFKLNMLQG